MDDEASHTARLSRDIDDAYAAYNAGDPDREKALYLSLRAQAENIVWHHPGVDTGTLISDIVHRAMVGLKTFRGESRLSTWFWTLAQNEVDRELRNLIQNRKRFQSLSTGESPGDDERVGETSQADIPAQPASQDSAIDLDNVWQDLPVKQDELVQLMVEGYSLAEVAKKLGVPLGTVRGRYRLAKKKMAERVHKKKPRR